MQPDFSVRCGVASGGALPAPRSSQLPLSFRGAGANVCLRIEDISSALWARVPELFRDLIDVAAYVYCADQACTRGGDCDEGFGAHWRRRFHLAVPVRRPDVWRAAPALDRLTDALSFLSEDEYHFYFEPLGEADREQDYLGLGVNPFAGRAEEVMLFSGGLDSLAGAALAVRDGRPALLVNHRPNPKVESVV